MSHTGFCINTMQLVCLVVFNLVLFVGVSAHHRFYYFIYLFSRFLIGSTILLDYCNIIEEIGHTILRIPFFIILKRTMLCDT